MKILLIVVLSVAAGVFAGHWFWPGASGAGPAAPSAAAPGPAASGAAPTIWTCSMHPQIRLPAPGQCPICGMDLIPASADAGAGGPVVLGPGAQQVASIETAKVGPRLLEREIRTVGRIESAEPQVAYLTARADGRVERVFADFTGVDVKKDDHLVDIYSPDLVVAQEEYLIAARNLEPGALGAGVPAAASETWRRQKALARQKLLLLGVTEDQIAKLAETGESQVVLTVFAPIGGTVLAKNVRPQMYVKAGDQLYMIADLSVVWLFADVYEYELPWVALGQEAEVEVEGAPGETFRGTVAFLEPVVNDATRTVRVRMNLVNLERRLRPGMFARARIRAQIGPDGKRAEPLLPGKWTCRMHPEVWSDEPGNCSVCGMELVERPGKPAVAPAAPVTVWTCPMHPEIRSDGPGKCPICKMKLVEKTEHPPGGGPVLAVPVTAVLDTGTRRAVYVEREPGKFEIAEVTLGPKAGDFYPVLSGLKDGDAVVVRGNFLLDSQSQIEGRPSLLFPKGLEAGTGTAPKGGHEGHD